MLGMAWSFVAAPLILCCIAVVVTKWLRQKMIEELGLPDLPSLGLPTSEDKKIKGTAVICGGSIAGMLAARVCHDHFDRVVIIEAEEWLPGEDGCNPQPWTQKHRRSRVGQYYSPQALMPVVYMSFKRLFPNFDEECQVSDCRVLTADFHFYLRGRRCLVPYHLGDKLTKTLFASRQGLETLLRRLLLTRGSYPNIQWISGTVTGVAVDPQDTGRLRKVFAHTSQGDTDITAALVVDCTGVSQAGPKWLRRAGYDCKPGSDANGPLVVSYKPNIHYDSFTFTLTPDMCAHLPIPGGYNNSGNFISLMSNLEADGRFLGGAKLEGARLLIFVGDRSPVEQLPRTLHEIKSFSRSLIVDKPVPEWWFEMLDMLDGCEDTMEYHPFRVPVSRYLRFHAASCLPSNFIAIGDSVLHLNPLHGHGIPSIVLGCITLNKMLNESVALVDAKVSILPADFSKRFFNAQWRKIETFWERAKCFDYGYKTTGPSAGETLSVGSWKRWYIHHFTLLILKDKEAGEVWWHTVMLLTPIIDLLHPQIVFKVLLHALCGGSD